MKKAPAGWQLTASFHLSVGRAGKACTIGITRDDDGHWLVAAIEIQKPKKKTKGPITVRRVERVIKGHGHDIIGVFGSAGEAFQRGEAYARAWQAGDFEAMRCACAVISKPKKHGRLPKVGDAVLAIGPQRVRGRIVEDRGNIGAGGRRIVSIRIPQGKGIAPLFVEAPVDDLRVRRCAA